MLLPAKIFLFWQVVAFQNIEIILDMIQGREPRLQFFQGGIIGFFICLQGIIAELTIRFKLANQTKDAVGKLLSPAGDQNP